MMSQSQTDANRRNALLSTGPRTENGKLRSRVNALQHGLAAETVVVGIEDAAEFNAFESEIVAEYEPKSVVERELTRRLASLLWRLRRASSIQTGLLTIESRQPQNHEGKKKIKCQLVLRNSAAVIPWGSATKDSSDSKNRYDGSMANGHAQESNSCHNVEISAEAAQERQRAIIGRFLQLSNINGDPLERISRYEAALWRQFLQALYSLDQAKHHRIAFSRGRFTPHPPQW